MAGVTSRVNVTIKPVARSAAGGIDDQYAIELSSSQVKFRLRRVKIRRVAGTAANLTPFVVNASGALSTSINKVWLGAAASVTPLYDVSPNSDDVTDSSGKVYLCIGWDNASDNTADYVLMFEILA